MEQRLVGSKATASVVLVSALSAAPLSFAENEDTLVLDGDVSAVYAAGNFVVWKPKSASGATGMTKAATMTPAGGKPPSIEDTLDVVAKAPIAADGTLRLEVVVDTPPRLVFFYVLDAVGHQGQGYAPTKGNAFILEPGRLTLHMERAGRFTIEGGKYNDAVYNTWRRSEEYMAAQREYDRLLAPVQDETEAQRRDRVDESALAHTRFLDLETEGRAEVATTHPDPLVRRLVIETAWLHGPWILDSLRGLAELTPDDPWVVERLAKAEASAAKRAEERKRFAVGAGIRDFEGETLAGDTIQLADVRANSKIVLVEFWASWCGPCRVEIPHMKEAYERYRPKGFEIVSFTIDEVREDWEEASQQEALPWIDLGMGLDAEAPVAYNVTGVPKNYLVESSTGNILARDLRGHRLDEKLDELLNEAAP